MAVPNKKFLRLTALIAVVLFFLSSCASVPNQIPETMREACTLYQSVRPEIVKAREFARINWNFIPPDVQATLLKIDAYLPELDRAGVTICAASQVPGSVRVNWDDVLTTVVRAATFAADLKKKGVI